MSRPLKKPRMVSIPENRVITPEDYADISEHARKSAFYYASERGKTSGEIRQKLLDKGYVDGYVYVAADMSSDEGRAAYDIITDTIEMLDDALMIHDEQIAEDTVRGMLDRGKGSREIREKLHRRLLASDIIESSVASIDDEDEMQSLRDIAQRYMERSTYQKTEDAFSRRQKLSAFLARRGFSYEQINRFTDEMR